MKRLFLVLSLSGLMLLPALPAQAHTVVCAPAADAGSESSAEHNNASPSEIRADPPDNQGTGTALGRSPALINDEGERRDPCEPNRPN